MKKIIILGSTGMLGNTVTKYFLGTNKYDISVSVRNVDAKTDDNFLFNPVVDGVEDLPDADVYINTIGVIKPRMLNNIQDSIYVNAIFPRELADECNRKGTKLIHITTDCVFSGNGGNYDEDSLHDALDDYGKSKSLGEPENTTVIRASIIGEEKGQARSLVEWIKSNKGNTVNGFTNHFWNGITCLQFAKICEYMIDNNLFWEGVKHIASPTVINKLELVTMVSDIYDLNMNVTPFEAPTKCDRSMSSIRNDIKIDVPELEIQIKEMRDFYKPRK